jgi:hypothetical protein
LFIFRERLPANLVDCLGELFLDVKSVENMNRVGTFLFDYLQVRLPDVAASVTDLFAATLASFLAFVKHSKEAKKGAGCAIPTDP